MSRNPFASDWLRGAESDRQRPHGGLSYVSGATDDPLRFLTIPGLLDRAVRRNGGSDAAIFAADGVRLSWHDLQARSDAVATGLLALGIGRGDRVGIWAPNCVEWLLVQFGTARIGAILVNINPAYRTSELEYALNKVQCRLLVMAGAHKSSDYVGMVRTLAPEIDRVPSSARLRLDRFERLRHIVLIGEGPKPRGMMSFDELTGGAGPAHHARLPSLSAALDPDDAINIQFTSGTTGSPKGATLSHFNVVNNARYCARAMALSERDRLCIPVPLYHCFGMVLGVLACTAVGAAMVFPGASFDAEETLRAVQAQRCTALHGVPTMFIAMLDHPRFRDYELSSLRTGIMAGAPCPIETMRRVVDQMHMNEVTIGYGMTETSPISFQSGVDDPIDRRVSTVGRIQPHAEVKIVDDAGRIVPVGATGELCTRGYLVMRGYWDDPERTREAIDEAGWMHTGDLATIDAEGYCNIVGRVKDMLIRGGENVYPREIEEFLHTHPKVQEVQVFGVPDPRFGEEVCAWIVLRPGQSVTAEEIKAFCQGRIAHYKVPRYIRFVPEFPLTATGKPQKYVMREQTMRDSGLSQARTA
ncbi:MAG: AMP-binding protein [Burkholderiales bacterium]|nr:MAG: AMP-binding protein [Burkholderiales bacterium]